MFTAKTIEKHGPLRLGNFTKRHTKSFHLCLLLCDYRWSREFLRKHCVLNSMEEILSLTAKHCVLNSMEEILSLTDASDIEVGERLHRDVQKSEQHLSMGASPAVVPYAILR